MRLSIITAVFLVATLCLVAMGYVKSHDRQIAVGLQAITRSTPAPEPAPDLGPKQIQAYTHPSGTQVHKRAGATDEPPQPAVSEENHNAYVARRITQLQDLAMHDDSVSLSIILSELNNRDSEIRQAALDATIQFGSRDAIPKLIEAAGQVDDPKEKQALLDGAEYLKLPSLTEVMQAQQKQAPSTAR